MTEKSQFPILDSDLHLTKGVYRSRQNPTKIPQSWVPPFQGTYLVLSHLIECQEGTQGGLGEPRGKPGGPQGALVPLPWFSPGSPWSSLGPSLTLKQSETAVKEIS